MITIEHVPNPHGKYVKDFPFDLIEGEKTCLHDITVARPAGSPHRDLRMTKHGERLRDDLLSVPGITELAFYQNWEGHGRELFIGFSPAVSWEELWVHLEEYFVLLTSGASEESIAAHMTGARAALDVPSVVVERCPNERYFVLHLRQPISQKIYIAFGDDKLVGLLVPGLMAPLRKLNEEIRSKGYLSLRTHSISFEGPKENREAMIEKVLPEITRAVYGERPCHVSYAENTSPREEDPLDWDDDFQFASDLNWCDPEDNRI